MARGLRTKWKSGDRFLVRHKDNHIAVIEKKAGILTVPTPTKKGENLASLLASFLSGPKHRKPVFIVHRLDRPVSGLLVFGRTKEAKDKLVPQFAAHDVERRYVAVVQGSLQDDEGTFESHLHSESGTLKMYSGKEEGGKRADVTALLLYTKYS